MPAEQYGQPELMTYCICSCLSRPSIRFQKRISSLASRTLIYDGHIFRSRLSYLFIWASEIPLSIVCNSNLEAFWPWRCSHHPDFGNDIICKTFFSSDIFYCCYILLSETKNDIFPEMKKNGSIEGSMGISHKT